MSSIVVYQSKTGHTKAYANLLGESLNCQVVESKHFNQSVAQAYDQIIYLGWLRASKVVGLNSFLRKTNKDNKILIGAVGASPKTEDYVKKVIQANFESTPSYPLFYLQGGFNPDKLSIPMKFMLGKVADSIKKKQEKAPETLTDEDRDFLGFFQTKHSDVSIENLKEMINYLHI